MTRPTIRPAPLVRAGLASAIALALAACTPTADEAPPSAAASSSAGPTKAAVGFAQFPDIAVPAGARMDVDRTLVLGARDAWIGRLAMSSSGGVTETFDYFMGEMPKFGWQEITTVRSEVSVLTYAREGRIATVQIRPRTLGGALIDVTVSPRGRPVERAETMSGNMPGGTSGNAPGAVTVQPLR